MNFIKQNKSFSQKKKKKSRRYLRSTKYLGWFWLCGCVGGVGSVKAWIMVGVRQILA